MAKIVCKANQHNLLLNHTYFVILVNVEYRGVEINIMRIVKYEYDEYFKTWNE